MGGNCLAAWPPADRMGGKCSSRIAMADLLDVQDRKTCGQDSCRLYLVSCLSHQEEDSSSWIGTAAGNCAEGDLFCAIPGAATTLVLRVTRQAIDDEADHAGRGSGNHATVVGVATGPDKEASFGTKAEPLWNYESHSRHTLSIQISQTPSSPFYIRKQARPAASANLWTMRATSPWGPTGSLLASPWVNKT
jgi:hypothetical protein